MPKYLTSSKEDTDFAKSYEWYGLQLHPVGAKQSLGECPFCEKDKFYVNRETGLFDCKVCGEKGNLVVFLRKLWELLSSDEYDYSDLVEERKLLYPSTPQKWGVVSSLTNSWLIPGFNSEGEITQLYTYLEEGRSGKKKLYATPGLKYEKSSAHGMHWFISGDPKSDTVLITEGCWDGMLLAEVLGEKAFILAVPGCNVFLNNWCSYCSGKRVILLYDNDHPRTVRVGKDSLRQVDPASITGIKKAASTLMTYKDPPWSVSYLKWGPKDHDPSLKTGYDVGDYLRQEDTYEERKKLWATLSQRIALVPDEWIVLDTPKEINITPMECESWKELVTSWRKSGMHWHDPGEGLDYTLSIMLACILSTSTQGENIWIKVVGPPSCGKSVLAEACAVAKKRVKSLSTIRGMYSGYRTTKDDEEDNSLIPLIKDKTLILKEGNTLVKSANFDRVLSELRDLYDGAGRSHFNNRMGKDYEGVRFTIIICGTEAYMDIFDRSELGERFIDCVVIKEMEEETEDEIGWKVALRASSEVDVSSNGSAESFMSPEMLEAKRKTGGYIEFLRNNGARLIKKVKVPENNLRYCQLLATFVSFMRTKPPLEKGKGHPEVKAQRELSFRLIEQFVRLAKCLAAVLGKESLDDSVMDRVKQVGLDTSRGDSLEICEYLYNAGNKGLEVHALAILLNQSDERVRHLLRFLRKIGVVELDDSHANSQHRFLKQSKRWVLTGRLRRLYEKVILEQEG